MSASTAAPAQHKQPSRKGKKAWRKNVDVTQVQDGLNEVRDQIIQGGVIAEKSADQLFAVDTSGSAEIQKEVAKRHKPLKVDDILAQRSAVPAVSSRKRFSDVVAEPAKKKAKISYKERARLREIADAPHTGHKDVVKTGDAADHDPWAPVVEVADPRFSYLEKKKPKVEPRTLKQAPVSLAKSGKAIPAIRKPEAGKSYNPAVHDWIALIEREGNKEIEAEKKRLAEAQEEERKRQLILAAAAEESEDGNESAWESEWEGFQSEVEVEGLKKKRPERKTPVQRNKFKRRKEAEQQAKHDARMKERDRQTARIKELAKSVEEKERAKARAKELVLAMQDESSDGDEQVLRRKGFGKHAIPDSPLEVVLPDELQDSLRKLKPEGNLLRDRMRSMIVRGKIESRRESQRKQPKRFVTEKWSHKDWKLEHVR